LITNSNKKLANAPNFGWQTLLDHKPFEVLVITSTIAQTYKLSTQPWSDIDFIFLKIFIACSLDELFSPFELISLLQCHTNAKFWSFWVVFYMTYVFWIFWVECEQVFIHKFTISMCDKWILFN
jgi:hypothetical protein